MEASLEGRVETAHITGMYHGNVAVGVLQGNSAYNGLEVPITHAEQYVGEDCLVRFLAGNKADRYPHFLSADTSQIFGSVEQHKYVLCGLWEEDMEKSSIFPTADEVNLHYDPGNLIVFAYNKKESTNRKGRVLIFNENQFHTVSSYRAALRNKKFNSDSNSQFFLVESPEQLEELKQIVMELDRLPIVLDRID